MTKHKNNKYQKVEVLTEIQKLRKKSDSDEFLNIEEFACPTGRTEEEACKQELLNSHQNKLNN